MWRIYDADWTTASQPYNITQPFRPDNAPMTLQRWGGPWKHVRYSGTPSAYFSAPFGDLTGIYSTGFADCLCLCLLSGRVNKYHGDYYSGALAHLDGGNITTLDLAAFVAGTGYTKKGIAQGSGVNNWFFHAILAGNTSSLSEFMQGMTLDTFKDATGINDGCITVYRGRIQTGFGITRKGWVGVPTFGNTGGGPASPEDK
jgi:hypothetical protein